MNTAVLDYSEVRILNNKMRRARQLRRRITLFCISVLLIIFICFIFKCASSSAKDINDKTLYKYYKSVQVQYGDTLETIVNKNITKEKYSAKELTEEIVFINSLDNDCYLQAGSYIIVPYYDEYRG